MSQELTKPDETIPLTPENLTALMQRPLLAVPREVRPAVWSVWIIQEHLFKTPLSIAGAIATDISHGLMVQDAIAILEAIGSPEERSRFRFASEFMTELARRTALAIKQRKQQADQAERLAEYTPPPARPQSSDDYAAPSDEEVAWQKRKLREIAERVGSNP